MTFTMPRIATNVKLATKQLQLYSLFRKDGRNNFTRVSDNSYTLELAMIVFAKRTKENNLFLRPIVIKCDMAEGITRHRRVHFKPTARKQFGVSSQ